MLINWNIGTNYITKKMKKQTLIINGHPDTKSYCYAIHNAYKKGVLKMMGLKVFSVVKQVFKSVSCTISTNIFL